ncbi:MAG: hypothetical protein ACRDRT_13495, partial [Pseudonocardiaceae bacterium]
MIIVLDDQMALGLVEVERLDGGMGDESEHGYFLRLAILTVVSGAPVSVVVSTTVGSATVASGACSSVVG